MCGDETKDELDRCLIWDAVYKNDGLSCEDIKIEMESPCSMARIRTLVNDKWFTKRGNLIKIAY